MALQTPVVQGQLRSCKEAKDFPRVFRVKSERFMFINQDQASSIIDDQKFKCMQESVCANLNLS